MDTEETKVEGAEIAPEVAPEDDKVEGEEGRGSVGDAVEAV